MHESVADIEALQFLLDTSFTSAGSHLRSIHEEKQRLSAQEVCTELSGVCILHLATVSASGMPIVAPVDGLFLKGKFWFCSAATSVRFGHIRQNNRVSAAYTRGETLSVLVHGVAHEVDTEGGGHDDVRQYCLEVYGPSYSEWGYWGRYPFAWIEPRRMFAGYMPGA